MQADKDFVVNPDGSVTSLVGETAKVNIENEDLYSERSRLVYESSHPERFSADEIEQKKAQIAQLDKILGRQTNALKAGKEMLLKKLAAQQNQQQSGLNLSDIISQQKQND